MKKKSLCKYIALSAVLPLTLGIFSGCSDTSKSADDKNDNKTAENGKYFGEDEIILSVFWPPSKGYTTQKQYDYLKEAKIDLLEWGSDVIFTDEATLKKTLTLCEKNGIKITVCDDSFGDGLIGKSEDEISGIVSKYRKYDCVAGFYIKDEPVNANPYFESVEKITKYYPGAICQMNFFPFGAVSDYNGYIGDYAALSGGDRSVIRYLSFDAYPFGLAEGSIPQMFGNLNIIRETGLKYNLDTAMYLQSIGVVGGFRKPTVDETRYHASAALAYGFKNLKYFTWITPVERSEEFTNAIINPDGSKNEVFDGIVDINTKIKAVSSILGRLDAAEIYHSGRQDSSTVMLNENRFVKSECKNDFLVSFMVDRHDGTNYLMFVNKNFKDGSLISVSLSSDITDSDIYDVTGGSSEQKKVTAENGILSMNIEAGGFALFKLGEGVNILAESEETDASANLAAGKAVFVSQSEGSNGEFAYMANDGVRVSSSSAKGWSFKLTSKVSSAYLTVDLGKSTEFNRVDLFDSGTPGNENYGKKLPQSFEIQYSDDNKTWSTAVSVTNFITERGTAPTFTFPASKGRYVRIYIERSDINKIGKYIITELEIYNDDGTIPVTRLDQFDPDALGHLENLADGKKVTVSSSYEADGWSKNYLTDGIKTADGTKNGWTTTPGRNPNNPDAEEWCVIDFQNICDFNTVVLYPRQDGPGAYFPQSFKIQISNDKEEWTDIAVYTENSSIGTLPRIVEFANVTGRYVRILSLKMTEPEGSRDGYLMQFAEIEIYNK